MRGMITQAGGAVYSQELINWSNTSHLIDCITIFGRADGQDPDPKIIENAHFFKVADVVRNIAPLYCG